MPKNTGTTYLDYQSDRQQVNPSLAPSNLFGYSQSVWDPSSYNTGTATLPNQAAYSQWSQNHYAPADLPSLPSFAASNVNPSDWTAQAFGVQNPQAERDNRMLANGNVWDPAYYNPMNQQIGTYSAPARQQSQTAVADLGSRAARAIEATYGSGGGGLPSGYVNAGGGLVMTPDGRMIDAGSIGGPPATAMGYASPAMGGSVQTGGGGGLPSGYVNAGGGLVMDPNGNLIDAGSVPGGGGSSAGGASGSMCYLTTAAVEGHEPDDGPTLSALRWFRDEIMGGRMADEIAEYYRTAPGIVAWIDAHPKRERIYQLIRESVLKRCISQINRFEFGKCRALYKRMVKFLEARANG